ncbi:MAG: AAA family ATPase [Fimbriimonas sp.]|nr:AAA family ATPase [Fimbriimonas sp.]
MYEYNEFEDETLAPDFWTKDHYDDEPDHPLTGKANKNYDPVCYLRTGPPLPVPDAFHQVKAERLQSYGRANGHQKLWIQNSLVLLAGPPKIGKTTIAVALGKAIAQGKPFGGFQLEKQAVGYLSFDDSPGEILATIDRHPDITANTNFYLNIEAQPIDTPQGLEAIENFLIKQRGNGIVIIDSFHAAIRKSQTRDARAIRKLITPLKYVAERAGTIILLHHTDARGNQIADHTQLQAAVSQTIQMKLEQREKGRIIHWKSQGRGTGICRNAYFRSESETHYAPHNPNPLANLNPRDRSTKPILEALQKKPMNVHDLSSKTGLTVRRVQKRIKHLLESAIVTRTNTGHFTCPA